MSGAGRGTPRISPAYDSDPIIANLNVPSGQNASLDALGNGRWCYSLTPPSNIQTLTGAFVAWQDNGGNTALIYPDGATRGLLVMSYTPNAALSQLEVKLQYLNRIGDPTGGVFSLGDTPTFPAVSDPLGASLEIAQPAFKTQAQGSTANYEFGLPFIIPAGCPGPVTALVREDVSAGGTLDILRLQVDNF